MRIPWWYLPMFGAQLSGVYVLGTILFGASSASLSGALWGIWAVVVAVLILGWVNARGWL